MLNTVTGITAARVMLLDGVSIHLHLVEAGLACCAVEQAAAMAVLDQLGASVSGDAEQGAPGGQARGDDQPRALSILVVSGTVTDSMAPLLVEAFVGLPEPKAALSFGACAATGGPYWDSYAVMNGIDQLLPVDVYVPGCPPRPQAFVEGLRTLVAARSSEPR